MSARQIVRLIFFGSVSCKLIPPPQSFKYNAIYQLAQVEGDTIKAAVMRPLPKLYADPAIWEQVLQHPAEHPGV